LNFVLRICFGFRHSNLILLFHFNPGCFTAAYAEPVAAQGKFNWIAERRSAQHLHIDPWRQAHFQQSGGDFVKLADSHHPAARADRQLRQGGHGLILALNQHVQEFVAANAKRPLMQTHNTGTTGADHFQRRAVLKSQLPKPLHLIATTNHFGYGSTATS
jgi:hypothetical protein